MADKLLRFYKTYLECLRNFYTEQILQQDFLCGDHQRDTRRTLFPKTLTLCCVGTPHMADRTSVKHRHLGRSPQTLVESGFWSKPLQHQMEGLDKEAVLKKTTTKLSLMVLLCCWASRHITIRPFPNPGPFFVFWQPTSCCFIKDIIDGHSGSFLWQELHFVSWVKNKRLEH